MKKLRKTQAALNLPTLTLEGALFLPDQLEKAALGRADWQTWYAAFNCYISPINAG
jgi:hypothetical protein